MVPKGFKAFGGGGETALNPFVLAILVIGVIAIWCVPKRRMFVPLLTVALLVSLTQQVVVLGLHLTVIRIAILCAWMRQLVQWGLHGKLIRNGFNAVDKVFAAWVLSGAIAFTFLYADVGALIFKLGFAFNAFGIYFLFRQGIHDRASIVRLVRILAVLCVVIAVLMLFERSTGYNLFSFVGCPLQDDVRLGRVRAQGPFVHSIIAGTVGAMLMPIFVGIWGFGDLRKYAIAGLMATAVMIITSASATPIAACLAGLVSLCMWPLRNRMQMIRWAIAVVVVVMHLVMKAPVWALLARFDAVGGSSGWHRFMLVDQFIRRFGDWWLVGTTSNALWGYDMWDKANWYVESGLTGGLATVVLFVAIIGYAFRAVGIGRRRCIGDRSTERFVWGLGCALFAGAVAFIGIYLIDQSIIAWYAILALIVAASAGGLQEPVPESQGESLETAMSPFRRKAMPDTRKCYREAL